MQSQRPYEKRWPINYFFFIVSIILDSQSSYDFLFTLEAREEYKHGVKRIFYGQSLMNAVCTLVMSESESKLKDETFVVKHIVRHYRRIKKNITGILLMSSKTKSTFISCLVVCLSQEIK